MEILTLETFVFHSHFVLKINFKKKDKNFSRSFRFESRVLSAETIRRSSRRPETFLFVVFRKKTRSLVEMENKEEENDDFRFVFTCPVHFVRLFKDKENGARETIQVFVFIERHFSIL